MPIKVRVTGIEETMRKLQAAFDKAAEERKQEVTDKLIEQLKDATPVKTGHARDSWEKREILGETVIVNTADYIQELNEGSSKQAPSHFIEKTILANPEVKPNGIIVTYDDNIVEK